MTRNKPTPAALEHGSVVIRALSSLSSPHVEAAVAAAGDGWAVQTTDDYDGYLSIVVEPSEQASDRPAYLISGTLQQIELAEIRDETLTTILKASDMAAIVSELSRRLHA